MPRFFFHLAVQISNLIADDFPLYLGQVQSTRWTWSLSLQIHPAWIVRPHQTNCTISRNPKVAKRNVTGEWSKTKLKTLKRPGVNGSMWFNEKRLSANVKTALMVFFPVAEIEFGTPEMSRGRITSTITLVDFFLRVDLLNGIYQTSRCNVFLAG